MSEPKQRHFVFFLCPRLSLFTLVAALEVLRHANRMAEYKAYHWSFLTEEESGVLDSNGLWLYPTTRIETIEKIAPVDIIFVVAGFSPLQVDIPHTAKWLKKKAQQGTVVAGISNGAFLLARLGLLDDYYATVHWEDFSSFCELYPRVKSRYQRYVIDGARMSCSGGASTLDLFVNIVRKDLGNDIAHQVSRQMLLQDYALSSTWQSASPISSHEGNQHFSSRVQQVLSLLEAGLEGKMNVNRLAEQIGLSRRELLRLLKHETGKTPSQLLAERRLERTRSLIMQTHLPLSAVAEATGFSSQSHMTHCYNRAFAITPAEHRRLYLKQPEQAERIGWMNKA